MLLVISALHLSTSYSPEQAFSYVGSQHWWESMQSVNGLSSHYDGYFCLCSCNATDEGIFCSGGGVTKAKTLVAKFLGVFEQLYNGLWKGNLVAYDTSRPFADVFEMESPGGRANYTGVSQALGNGSFVWRGYMSGVDCGFSSMCYDLCSPEEDFQLWLTTCGPTILKRPPTPAGALTQS